MSSGTSSRNVSHSRTRPGMSRRATSRSAVPALPHSAAELLLNDAGIGEEAAELLHEFVHPHAHPEDELEDEDELVARERAAMKAQPWWRRPAAAFVLCMVPLSAITTGATIAPRVEILTMLACDAHKPEYTAGHGLEDLGIALPWSAATGIAEADVPAFSWGPRPSESSWTKPDHTDAVFVPLEVGRGGDNSTVVPNPKMCKTDRVVQEAVAKLSTIMTTTMGVLGCLTVAWWGSMSDRYGRTRIISVTICGVVFQDFIFIFTTLFSKRLPGGYWFLLAGPVVDGCLGGISAASAAIHAYMSDCTEPSARSRVFSLYLGIFFIGMALGPTLGGLTVKYTGNALSVFYFATAVHSLYAFVSLFILPESLSPLQMRLARRQYAQETALAKGADSGAIGVRARTWIYLKRALGFAAPLAMFLPQAPAAAATPGKAAKKDWSLTLVAASYTFVVMILGSLTFKFQYALARYGWTSEQIGYWLSTVGATRAFHLTITLPLVIKFFKPKKPAIQLPQEEDEPLSVDNSSSAAHTASASSATAVGSSDQVPNKPKSVPPPSDHSLGSPEFDIRLARGSLLIEMFTYVLMTVAPTGLLFITAGAVSSFGSGFSPALQSVALELYTARGGAGGTGQLFGALSVLQALASQVVGPAVFGFIYFRTVAVFPQAIFVATIACVLIALVLLSFVRLPPRKGELEEGARPVTGGSVAGTNWGPYEPDERTPLRPSVDREETLVEVADPLGPKAAGTSD